jgi:hypothetical protein
LSGLVSATTIIPETTGCSLQAPVQFGHVLVEILDSVFVDVMLLEESIHLHTGPETEKLADLLHSQPTVPVRASHRLLQERTARIAAGGHEVPDKLVGDFDGNLHSLSVANRQRYAIHD